MFDPDRTGLLFNTDFLLQTVRSQPLYRSTDVSKLSGELSKAFEEFHGDLFPKEAYVAQKLTWRILEILGWQDFDRHVRLAEKGRDNVPDGLLYLNKSSKANANACENEWERFKFGAVIVESKRWKRALDRGSGEGSEAIAPTAQLLRYLRRVDDLTSGSIRWGILTNGAVWRLYYQSARSVSDQYLEIDLYELLQSSEQDFDGQVQLSNREHWLRVFAVMFQKSSFEMSPNDSKTFHFKALQEGRYYGERVTKKLSEVVFKTVFPDLSKAIASSSPEANLADVRHATLILLYRMLFIFYAEDRNLLPVRDSRYENYALRYKVREDVGRRKDMKQTFSNLIYQYWSAIETLSLAIDAGDSSTGLPPYNGGLFDRQATPILNNLRVADDVMSEVVDLLSYEIHNGVLRYINYRNLSVQQLGSIYERLLEFELRDDPEKGLVIHPNSYARKSSGAYYTPESLVKLVIKETLEPLVADKLSVFNDMSEKLAQESLAENVIMRKLREVDPAEALLNLRICDPAMGSGHFLVSLVDYLADAVVEAVSEVSNIVDWTDKTYVSPLADRIEKIRDKIEGNADKHDWSVDPEQLDDWNIIRRIILKRCVYGVDKNPMAVELAKVSLWLHTFTAGAPLSFIDHHLRCGDSLFGETVGSVLTRISNAGHKFFIGSELNAAYKSAADMHHIEKITDIEISEAHASADLYEGVKQRTKPLDHFMKVYLALDWLSPTDKETQAAISAWLDGQFGNPIQVALGNLYLTAACTVAEDPEKIEVSDHLSKSSSKDARRFAEVLAQALSLIEEEKFMNWEVTFPGVWHDWDKERTGGFDAIIGNPPWDIFEFQEVPWFEVRHPSVALIPRKSDRTKAIDDLKVTNRALWEEYEHARNRFNQATKQIKKRQSPYRWNNKGRMDLYKLFAERAIQLLSPSGIAGFLVKAGIATDKGTAEFFHNLATSDRVKTLYGFENRKVFFPDIHAGEKPCVFVASRQRQFKSTICAFGLHSVEELEDKDRIFSLTAKDFSLLNPNTKTAPVFRSSKDAQLTFLAYRRHPILERQKDSESQWPVTYHQMLNVSSDESLFRTSAQLESEEGAYPIDGNRYRTASKVWVPIYEGKMVQAYDHRASDIVINSKNVFRPGQQVAVPAAEKLNPDRLAKPRFYVEQTKSSWPSTDEWIIGFKDVTATTNMRTMIATIIPRSAAANTLPVLSVNYEVQDRALVACQILATMNSIAYDFIARQKVPGIHLTWYVLRQLPVIPLSELADTKFGSKSAQQIIKEIVVELIYTSNDLKPFAMDIGHSDETGKVFKPYEWDELRRVKLMAKLDALFMYLYGYFEPEALRRSQENIRYIYSTFKIVEREETKKFGRYFSRDLALAYCNSLAAGVPDAEPSV